MGQIIGAPLGWIIYLCYKVIPVYGIALILFTIIAKMLMLPLAIKQQKSAAKMALFKPKLDALQKKYANNKQKYQEEMMKLYEEEGYNPMSAGCLPMLIQLPILYGLIDVIYKPLTHVLRIDKSVIQAAMKILEGIETSGTAYTAEISIISEVAKNPAAFSSLPAEALNKIANFDLSFLGINLGEVPTWTFSLIVLVPILSGITSALLSFISMKINRTPGQEQQSMKGMNFVMLAIMPIFSAYFATVVPAGVGFYWLITNVISIIQTVVLAKFYNAEKLAEKIAQENEAKKAKRKAKIAAMREAQAKVEETNKSNGNTKASNEKWTSSAIDTENLSAKEINRIKIAEARRKMAEKYGDEYIEDSEDDLK